MTDADHARECATRLLALALQAREQGRIENAEQLTGLATQAFERASAPLSHGAAAEPSRSVAQQQQQPQARDGDPAEPHDSVTRDRRDDDRKP